MRRTDWKRRLPILAIALLWGWGAANVGKGDYEEALIRDAIRKDPPRAQAEPNPCDATVWQSGERPRCYVRSHAKQGPVQK